MDGVVVLLKPPGMTSNNAVSDMRKLFSEKRVGHTGTLDPGAAGVLPVCLGRAAKLFEYLVEKEKTYIAEVAFGTRTDTQDAYGKALARSDRLVDAASLQSALPAFIGVSEQTAPAYSALKVEGKRMCDLARAGQTVEARVRTIGITELDVLQQTGRNRFLFRVGCTRGTYVRTLCEDIGVAVGCPAHLSFLLRTASGPFRIEDAYTVEELATMKTEGRLEDAVLTTEDALAFLPKLVLPPDREIPSKNSLPTNQRGLKDGVVRLYAGDVFLGVGGIKNGAARLTVHLY